MLNNSGLKNFIGYFCGAMLDNSKLELKFIEGTCLKNNIKKPVLLLSLEGCKEIPQILFELSNYIDAEIDSIVSLKEGDDELLKINFCWVNKW